MLDTKHNKTNQHLEENKQVLQLPKEASFPTQQRVKTTSSGALYPCWNTEYHL